MSELAAYGGGFVTGAIAVAISLWAVGELQGFACAEKHNVYRCERVVTYVPSKPEARNE